MCQLLELCRQSLNAGRPASELHHGIGENPEQLTPEQLCFVSLCLVAYPVKAVPSLSQKEYVSAFSKTGCHMLLHTGTRCSRIHRGPRESHDSHAACQACAVTLGSSA